MLIWLALAIQDAQHDAHSYCPLCKKKEKKSMPNYNKKTSYNAIGGPRSSESRCSLLVNQDQKKKKMDFTDEKGETLLSDSRIGNQELEKCVPT